MAVTDDDLSDSDDSLNSISMDAPIASYTGQQRVERLRFLRERFNWGIKTERHVFFGKFKTLIVGWTDHLPELREFFDRDEMDWMLADFVGDYDIETLAFFEFVYDSGYRDAPDVDEAGDPTELRRATALHRALDQEPELRKDIAGKLFKIYECRDANYEDENGVTHFHVACETGCADVVNEFLDLGQDVDLPVKKTGKTPLQLALLNKHRDVVEVLLDHGADPNLPDKFGLTALHLACKMAPSDGAKVVAIIDTIFEICTERRRSVEVDALDMIDRTALQLAVQLGQKPIIEALLRWGADPNRRCANGMTYLHFMCRKPGDDDLAELFLEINDDAGRKLLIDARDNLGWTPLHYALYYGKWRTIDALLKWNADPNSRILVGGFTPLHLIAHRKTDDDLAKMFFKTVKIIGERVEVDAVDDQGWTGLLAALNLGHTKTFEALLRNGADPNFARKDDSTALHAICKKKGDQCEFLKKLFEICVDARKIAVRVDARDQHGWTALHLALRDGKRGIVEELLRRGANPNLTRENGSTALHTVCKRPDDDHDNVGDLATMIFELCHEAHKPLLVDARDKHGWTPLNLALYYRKAKVVEELLRGGADPNLIHAKALTPLHIVCQGKTDDDLPEIFLRTVDNIGKTVRLDAPDEVGKTPLQHTLFHAKRRNIEILLRRGADPNVADSRGYAVLHSIVVRKEEDDLLERFLEICAELELPLLIDAPDKHGFTPLHLAFHYYKRRAVGLLLRNGANPNLAQTNGSYTPLHLASKRDDDKEADDLATMILELSSDAHRPIEIDARDKRGWTPLHLAVYMGFKRVMGTLLRNGADPNSTTEIGSSTVLHMIAKRQANVDDDELAEKFFEICDDLDLRIVNAQDDLGWTPLNLALYYGNGELAELLLRRGADSNLANRKGSTPLHTIAGRKVDDDLAETFFRIIDDVGQTVQLDARDKARWTPLQLAVTHRLPRLVDTLLARGANLAEFAFPNVIAFKEIEFQENGLKLREAARMLQVVERLKNRGFEIKRKHVVAIKTFFKNHLSLDTSKRLESWHNDEEFASLAKEIAIRPSLTLYDLTRSPTERVQVEPALTYEDYSRLSETEQFGRLAEGHLEACTTHLCEMMSGDFFRRWKLDPFAELRATTTTNGSSSPAPSRRNHSEEEESQDVQVLPSPSKKRRC